MKTSSEDPPGARSFLYKGKPVAFQDGDSLLLALLRADEHPTGGGCLCLAGDCPHCVAVVDGVAYTRTCQTRARRDLAVEPHPPDGAPPLEAEREPAPTLAVGRSCDVVVIGAGTAGRSAAESARRKGKDVLVFDAHAGEEVAGIYHGPLVLVRTEDGMLRVRAREEVIVATGAAELQPVAPGTHLRGLVTARAASALHAAGIDLGKVVALGTPPEDVDAEVVEGELIAFEGEECVEAVLVRTADGSEHRYACDTVSFGLGLQPRDALARMGRGLPVRAVGDAALDSDIPPCPRAGTVCSCSGVTVTDLESVWERGFHELELVKRATLAGTGTCQGSACMPHVRSFLMEQGKTLQAPFTARPMTRSLTVAETAAGAWHRPTRRTPLHDQNLQLGARMERSGGWWRAWTYGDPDEEYRAVRERVSLGDVSTLGKFLVAGNDALAFLNHLYPNDVSTLKDGRARYALLLDERGYVLDDGMICRESADRFYLTLTSAGASFGEMWLRDWADGLGFDVRILNQTSSYGAINVTGPDAARLLRRTGIELPGFAKHGVGEIAGLPCRILRLSFTGELSYELHTSFLETRRLWHVLLELGRDLGIRPHGLDTLFQLRLEKGHLIVGQDTAFDSTPRRLDLEGAVDLRKERFVGRQAVVRTNREPLDRCLVGLEMDGPPPIEGAVIYREGEYAGYVTSSTASPVLGKTVLLAWVFLDGNELPQEVTIDGRRARRTPIPFYDPQGKRARVRLGEREEEWDPWEYEETLTSADATSADAFSHPEELARPAGGPADILRLHPSSLCRVAAPPAMIDAAEPNCEVLPWQIAPDEVLLSPFDAGLFADRPGVVVEKRSAYYIAELDAARVLRMIEHAADWEIPPERPALLQGALAGIPVKILLQEKEIASIAVEACFVAVLEERWNALEGRLHE